MPMQPSIVYDPNAGDYTEQKDGFLVLECRAFSHAVTLAGVFPTLSEAEEMARQGVRAHQADNAFVVPAKLACRFKRN